MMLNGKAKEDFEKWFDTEYRFFSTSYGENVDKINNYIVIEWFRECAFIHSQIFPFGDKKSWCYNLSDWKNDPDKTFYERLSSLKIRENREFEKFPSYEDAVTEAIKKANEIYNLRKSVNQ